MRVAILILITVCYGRTLAAPPLEGDKPIRVGGDGVGFLAAPDAYKTNPIGQANIFGGRRPDVFINSWRGVAPAIWLYRYVRDDSNGVPVFAAPLKVATPFGEKPTVDGITLFTNSQGVFAIYRDGNELIRWTFDREKMAFSEISRTPLKNLPASSTNFIVIEESAEKVVLAFSAASKTNLKPPGDPSRDDYVLYNAAGIYKGQWPFCGIYSIELSGDWKASRTPSKLASKSNEELMAGNMGLSRIDYSGGKSGLIGGQSLGNIYFFPTASDQKYADKNPLFTTAGMMIRHPTTGTRPMSYPNQQGQLVDLLVGGEGALFYYRFTAKFAAKQNPIYEPAVNVLQENADVFAGTLPVPTSVDWDGDGNSDLIIGNSEGFVLFYRNNGTDRAPQFGVGEQLKANGETIHIQPGYYGVQGPFEARWGYVCPNVADWNGDGLPDLLLSSATARHEVFLNVGTKSQPKLAAGKPLYCNGLELHGVWRVRPAVAKIGERMAYVIQDDFNALHIYWRIDDQNLEDGGQLKLTTGANITAHITGSATFLGQMGRGKIEMVDWDGDGKLDLFVGTDKRGSLPQPNTGLPWAHRRKTRALQVVYLKNVGSNEQPVYEYPKLLRFRGKDVYHGAHANSPAATKLGATSKKPNLLIGMEDGRIYFYAHDDITFADMPAEMFAKPDSNQPKEKDAGDGE